MSHYKATVNNSDPFPIEEDELNELNCINLPNKTFHILKNSKSHHIEFKSKNLDQKHYKMLINGREYEVSIQDSLDQLIESMGFQLGSSKMVNQIKAPMPGLILDINVDIGDEVNENSPLLILEAMKMENSLVSPSIGKVKNILVNKGETVTKNQLLIEFE